MVLHDPEHHCGVCSIDELKSESAELLRTAEVCQTLLSSLFAVSVDDLSTPVKVELTYKSCSSNVQGSQRNMRKCCPSSERHRATHHLINLGGSPVNIMVIVEAGMIKEPAHETTGSHSKSWQACQIERM